MAGQRENKRSTNTRGEVTVAALLRRHDVAFEQNAQIGRFNVDFLVSGHAVIECFGDYWHCNPLLYEAGWHNRSLRMTAEEKWAKDARRARALAIAGYSVHILWERDIHQAPEQVARLVKTILVRVGGAANADH